MATFLSLTNAVLARLNEVPLNSTTFSSASGFQLQAQLAVLDSIREINADQFLYPWQHTTETQTLTPGVISYPLPATLMAVDWNTFNIAPNVNVTPAMLAKSLRQQDYHEYMQENFPGDNQTIAQGSNYQVPTRVIQDQAGNFLISPPADRAYVVNYEGWEVPVDMQNAADVCPIPDRFSTVIIDGAMYYAYLFRDNIESAQLIQQKFKDGIGDIRRLVSPPMKSVRDTRAGPQFRLNSYSR